jgi:hypothetical protein
MSNPLPSNTKIFRLLGGTHSFDQVMNYNLKFDVPSKYLGTEASALIAKSLPADAAKRKYSN